MFLQCTALDVFTSDLAHGSVSRITLLGVSRAPRRCTELPAAAAATSAQKCVRSRSRVRTRRPWTTMTPSLRQRPPASVRRPASLFRIRSGGAATLGCIFVESFRVHLVHKSDVVFNQTVILKHFTPTFATFVIVTLTDCHRGLRQTR